MGFKKSNAVAVAEQPVADAPVAVSPEADTAPVILKRAYSAEEAKVRGQVRMHAIIAGYKVASSLAPTIANTSASIIGELHKLAAEVAVKIEAYSFLED